MDRSVNACTDFYQFACGGWRAHNPIPSDQASWSVYGKLYQDNQQFLWGILNGLVPATAGRTENQQKIGDYFAACMNDHLVEQLGGRPLAPTFARIEELKDKQGLPILLAELHLETNELANTWLADLAPILDNDWLDALLSSGFLLFFAPPRSDRGRN